MKMMQIGSLINVIEGAGIEIKVIRYITGNSWNIQVDLKDQHKAADIVSEHLKKQREQGIGIIGVSVTPEEECISDLRGWDI